MAELTNKIVACDTANREIYRWQRDRSQTADRTEEYRISNEVSQQSVRYSSRPYLCVEGNEAFTSIARLCESALVRTIQSGGKYNARGSYSQ